MRKIVKNENLVAFILIVFFVLDLFNFLIGKESGLLYNKSVTVYGKAFIQLIAIIGIFVSKKYRVELLLIVILIIIPSISYLFSFWHKGVRSDVLYMVFRESNKYVFPFILFLWFSLLNLDWNKVRYYFEGIYLLCALLVLVSFLFNIDFFYTYNSIRFGFKPPFAAQNEVTYFWMIGLIYFGHIYFNNRNILHAFFFLMILLASLLLGTKAISLFVFSFVIFLLNSELKISLKSKIIVFVGFFIALLAYVFYSGIFIFFYRIFVANGFWYAVTSSRNVLFEKYFLHLISEWNPWNYLVGGLYLKIPLVEMDVIDLLLFYGIIGSFIYVLILKRTLFSFGKDNVFGFFFASQYFIIGGVTGHVFPSGLNAIYVSLLCLYLQSQKLNGDIGS